MLAQFNWKQDFQLRLAKAPESEHYKFEEEQKEKSDPIEPYKNFLCHFEDKDNKQSPM